MDTLQQTQPTLEQQKQLQKEQFNSCLSNCQIKSIDGWKYTFISGLTGALVSNYMPLHMSTIQRRAPFFILTTLGIGLDWKTCADKCAAKYPPVHEIHHTMTHHPDDTLQYSEK